VTTLPTVRSHSDTPPPPTDEQLRCLGQTLLEAVRRADVAPDDLVVLTVRRQWGEVPEPTQFVVDVPTLLEAGHVLGALRQIRGGR